MLEKPDLQDDKIVACLQDAYGLLAFQVEFLPLGADVSTAVYRVVTEDDTAYFIKLRSGVFNEIALTLPKFLSDQGIEAIIPPLPSKTGQLWASLDAFKVILYPFVEGHDGYEVTLSDCHWEEFGRVLKRVHTVKVPPALIGRIRHESYSPEWRDAVRSFLECVEEAVYHDSTAIKVATLLKAKRYEILDLVRRADRLAKALQAQSSEFIVCHSDIHAGNLLIGGNGAFYIVDWDEPILAPKERDLMSIGAGLMASGLAPQEEEDRFYRAYGQTPIDPVALAYYRYERIIQDIAEFCKQLLLTDKGGIDREQSLRYLKSNFLPENTIEIAYRSDRTLRERGQ